MTIYLAMKSGKIGLIEINGDREYMTDFDVASPGWCYSFRIGADSGGGALTCLTYENPRDAIARMESMEIGPRVAEPNNKRFYAPLVEWIDGAAGGTDVYGDLEALSEVFERPAEAYEYARILAETFDSMESACVDAMDSLDEAFGDMAAPARLRQTELLATFAAAYMAVIDCCSVSKALATLLNQYKADADYGRMNADLIESRLGEDARC